jgi:hypothetical protein
MQSIKQALNPAFLKQPVNREDIELFKREFKTLLACINEKESEEYHKNLIIRFLNATYYKESHYLNTKDKTDLVIHNGKTPDSPVGVLIETKSPSNKTEMPSLNCFENSPTRHCEVRSNPEMRLDCFAMLAMTKKWAFKTATLPSFSAV